MTTKLRKKIILGTGNLYAEADPPVLFTLRVSAKMENKTTTIATTNQDKDPAGTRLGSF